MRTFIAIMLLGTLSIISTACDAEKSNVARKKEQLEKKRQEMNTLRTEILTLEKEISAIDPTFGKNENNIVLVAASPMLQQPFEHRIEVRGTVQSRKNILLSAETMGIITKINVREGQNVKKGELLLVINADVLYNNLEEIKTQLSLATTVFERQANLWKQNIGSEIQYLESKNRKEGLERSLKTLQSQLEQANIRAPFNGTIDEVTVNVGEMASPGSPMIRLVKLDEMYIQADVSERYIGKFKSNDDVDIFFPANEKEVSSQIAALSQVINNQNRTFSIEINLPDTDFMVKPNQVVVLSLKDYFKENALLVPTGIIQRDDIGNFVYEAKNIDGKLSAEKLHIETGLSFAGHTEVISGAKGNELIINKGFRELTNGIEIKLSDATVLNK